MFRKEVAELKLKPKQTMGAAKVGSLAFGARPCRGRQQSLRIPNRFWLHGWSCCSLVGETGLLLGALLAVGLDVGADAAGSSEVLLGLSGGGGSQEQRVGTSGGLHDKFVKSEAFAAGLGDSGAGSFGEAESGDGHFGAFNDSLVVGHGGDGDGDSVSLSAEVLLDLGDGQRGTVSPGSDQSPEDGGSELGAGSAGKEAE